MLIFLLLLYYLIVELFQTFWDLFPKPKLEIKQQPIIDASLIKIFLEEGTVEIEAQEIVASMY